MPLLTLGINHNTAPVEIRERISFAPDQVQAALRQVLDLKHVKEAVLLSTCNRTELYCNLDGDSFEPLLDWLAASRAPSDPDVSERFYIYKDEETIRHLFRVASGLDSMILGEPQILGQIKDAYQRARSAGTVGPALHRLFQRVFFVAKQIRTDTSIGQSPVSVAFAAVTLARQIFANFRELTALLVGAGATVELGARHLHQQGTGRMVIANRTIERARQLATQFGAYAISLDEIPLHLSEVDIVISSTASIEPIIRYDGVVEALAARKHRPVLMVDIAVPRDIEAEIGQLDDVYLYTIDNLRDVIQNNLKSREAAALEAEDIISTQVTRFGNEQRSLDVVPVIRAIRENAQVTREKTLRQARHMLDTNKSPQEVLEFLANTLTNRLLHDPSTRLRNADETDREKLITVARELFGIDEVDKH